MAENWDMETNGWSPSGLGGGSNSTAGSGWSNDVAGTTPAPMTAESVSPEKPPASTTPNMDNAGGQYSTWNTGGSAPYVNIGKLSGNSQFDQTLTPPPTDNSLVPGLEGPHIYGENGDMSRTAWQRKQAAEFNKNQLAGQADFNQARSQMPYNTTGNLANPYDQYVNNPATPGQPSVPSPGALATGNTFASGGNQDYQSNQLRFLLSALQNYGPGGQNRFGNSFSPIFTGGQQNGSLLNGLGNSAGNPGGYQSGNNGQGGGFGLAQLLPLLIGLAGNNGGMSPQAGTYGNLGADPQGIRRTTEPGRQFYDPSAPDKNYSDSSY